MQSFLKGAGFVSGAKLSFVLSAGLIAGLIAGSASANTVVFNNPDETTLANPNGGLSSARGIWFTTVTGVVDNRADSLFPTPLFEDSKYFLVMDTRFAPTEAEVFVEGLFGNGNDVFCTPDGNPAKFSTSDSISAANFHPSVFSDLGPTFGNWEPGDYGFLGLKFPIAGQTHYGFAEISVNADSSITLYSFGYNDVANAAVNPLSTVPEPASIALGLISLGAMSLRRRRRA